MAPFGRFYQDIDVAVAVHTLTGQYPAVRPRTLQLIMISLFLGDSSPLQNHGSLAEGSSFWRGSISHSITRHDVASAVLYTPQVSIAVRDLRCTAIFEAMEPCRL